jgi:hypothetical protein
MEGAAETEAGKVWRYIAAGYLNSDSTISFPENPRDIGKKIQAQQTLGNLMGIFLHTERPTGSRISQKWVDQDGAQREASSRLQAQMRS